LGEDAAASAKRLYGVTRAPEMAFWATSPGAATQTRPEEAGGYTVVQTSTLNNYVVLLLLSTDARERQELLGKIRLYPFSQRANPPRCGPAGSAGSGRVHRLGQERRDITVGQKATGYARLFPDPAKGGRGKKLSGSPDGLSQGHWKNLVA
jgi:hypothetical protein